MADIYTIDGRTDRLVAWVQDNGDGTGTRTVYDADGNVVATENLAGLPLPAVEVTDAERIAALEVQVDALLTALEA